MLRTARRIAARIAHTSAAVFYATLNGRIGADLAAGRLIRTGDLLDRLGAGDLPDGYQSWYGRHVAKHYRARVHREPTRCWVRHRTTGRWIQVCVYAPTDPALFAGLASYQRTRHLVTASYAEAA